MIILFNYVSSADWIKAVYHHFFYFFNNLNQLPHLPAVMATQMFQKGNSCHLAEPAWFQDSKCQEKERY